MLSHRLRTIAEMVSKDKVVADVGSDHGLLPCFLVRENIVPKAYAIDNKSGPLQSSIDNIEYYGLKNYVLPILSDGLQRVDVDDIETLMIAGMGYLTIKDILEADMQKVKKIDEVILQSNTEICALRTWIIDQKFKIIDECILKEKNKFYFIIKFETCEYSDYLEDDYLLGPILRNHRDSVYKEYLEYEINSRQQILQCQKTPTAERELELLKEFYNIFE